MEVQLHVDVRMRQKAGFQTTKIKSAKSFVMVHPRNFIPSKYTRYTVVVVEILNHNKNVRLKFHGFVVIVWQKLKVFYLHCIMQMLISHEVIAVLETNCMWL